VIRSKQRILTTRQENVMLRKLAVVTFCVSSLVSISAFAFDRSRPERLETIVAAKHLMLSSQQHKVTYDGNSIRVNGQPVEYHDLDASLRKPGALQDLFKSDYAKLEVTRRGAGYELARREQLRGGGLLGTSIGANIGYWGVHGITQAIVGIVVQPAYWILGPAGAGVHYAVSGAVHGLVQPLAITAGVAGGIAGGVATGPV
jgi:hypothetical protein